MHISTRSSESHDGKRISTRLSIGLAHAGAVHTLDTESFKAVVIQDAVWQERH